MPLLLPLSETAALPVDAAAIPDERRRGGGDQRQRDPPCAARTASRRLPACPASRSAKRPPQRRGRQAFGRSIEGPGDAEGLADTSLRPSARPDRSSISAGACGVRTSRSCSPPPASRSTPSKPMTRSAIDHADDADFARLIGGQPVDAALLYSAKAAEALLETCRHGRSLRDLFENTMFLACRPRIAACLGGKASGQNPASRRNQPKRRCFPCCGKSA